LKQISLELKQLIKFLKTKQKEKKGNKSLSGLINKNWLQKTDQKFTENDRKTG